MPLGKRLAWYQADSASNQAALINKLEADQDAVGDHGRSGCGPWEQVRGQIYLGSEAFIAQHQPNRVIHDIPRRRQTQA